MEKHTQTKRIKQTDFNTLSFDSLNEFDEFIEEEISSRLSIENSRIWKGVVRSTMGELRNADWFGTPVPDSIQELENHKEFQDPKLYKEVEEEIRNSLSEFEKMELFNPQHVKKIAYNSMGFGVFSFDRAAMGLQKIKAEDGKEKISTTVKEVYAYFTNKPQEQRSAKLYIVAGGLGSVSAKGMLYTGMGAVVLADYLTERNYAVEINVVIESLKNQQTAFMNIIRVKKSEDTLDRNSIAVLTSDPKYYRYKGFKGIVSIYNRFGEVCPDGLGGVVSREMMEDFVREEQSRSSTPIVIMANYTLNAVRDNIIQIIHQLKRKEYATKE